KRLREICKIRFLPVNSYQSSTSCGTFTVLFFLCSVPFPSGFSPDTVLGFSCGVSCSSAFFTSCSAVCEGVGRFSDSFVSFFECCEKSCGFFVSFLHDSLCAFLSLFPSSVPFFFHGCLIKLYTSRIGTVSDRVFKIIARKKGHKNGPKRKPTIPAAIQKSRYFMINAFHFFSIELLPFSGKKYFPAVNQI